MQRAMAIFIAAFATTCNIVPALSADETGPQVVLKVRTQIENKYQKSSHSSMMMYSFDKDDVSQINLDNYQIDVLISDLQAYELVVDLTLRNSIGTAVTSTQVLVPIKSESGFDLSTTEVSVSGTISVADVIYPVQNEK